MKRQRHSGRCTSKAPLPFMDLITRQNLQSINMQTAKICQVSEKRMVKILFLHIREKGAAFCARSHLHRGKGTYIIAPTDKGVLRRTPLVFLREALCMIDICSEHPHEECKVFGIYDPTSVCARTAYYGLYALQHRGQDACGIAVINDRELSSCAFWNTSIWPGPIP